jgi:hypothetical protein
MMGMVQFVGALVLVLSGCAVQTGAELPPQGDTGTATPDAFPDGAPDSRIDTGRDTGSPDSTADTSAPDTGAPDTSEPDTGAPDTGEPDTSVPDTAPPDTGPPPRELCVDAYGSERDYDECAMRDEECEFYVDPFGDDSCEAVCLRGGGTCEGTYNEGASRLCRRGSSRSCSAESNDFICICTRPFL